MVKDNVFMPTTNFRTVKIRNLRNPRDIAFLTIFTNTENKCLLFLVLRMLLECLRNDSPAVLIKKNWHCYSLVFVMHELTVSPSRCHLSQVLWMCQLTRWIWVLRWRNGILLPWRATRQMEENLPALDSDSNIR